MSRSTTAPTAVAVTTLATFSVLALGASGAVAAQPTSEGGPTSQARAAGIDRKGEASMGWRSSREGADTSAVPSGGVLGIDVSSHQGNVNWPAWYDAGKRFAYVKATEGTGYTNPYFGQQYTGSYDVGMVRGAYHFALPDVSGGSEQAGYFLRHGGGWSPDGDTLPGAVDLEWNPYGPACYGKTRAELRQWLSDFVERYEAEAGRPPVVYTNTSWWNECVGADSSFAADVPLWVARYGDTRGQLPGDWQYETFWQYSDDPIDQNRFNGTAAQLQAFAAG